MDRTLVFMGGSSENDDSTKSSLLIQCKFINSFVLIENRLKIANLYNYIPLNFDKDAKRCTGESKQHLQPM